MNRSHLWKTDMFFFIILFVLFIGLMVTLYSNYPYSPSALPNEYPQAFTAPG
jgi:hypothetical protein